MLHEYKQHVRYWIATRFGNIDRHDPNVYEIICPDCDMTTPIYADDCTEQSCYFCGGSLRADEEADTTEAVIEQPQKTPVTNIAD